MDDAACEFQICMLKKDIAQSLFRGKIPYTSWNLAADKVMTNQSNMDVFDLLYVFANEDNIEYMFSGIVIFRLFLAGFFLLIYFYKKSLAISHAVMGTMIYVFSGDIIVWGIMQPVYTYRFMLLPLMFLLLDGLIYEGKWIRFSLLIAYVTVCGIYGLYYNSVGLCYLFFPMMMEKEYGLRGCLIHIKRFIQSYIVGLLISAPVWIPFVSAFLGNGRLKTGASTVIANGYSQCISYIWKSLFFFMSGDFDIKNYGFTSLLLIPVMIAIIKKGRSNLRLWSLFFLLGIIVREMPIFLFVFGGGIPSDRWGIAMSICASLIFVHGISAFEETTKYELIKIDVISVIYIVAIGLLSYQLHGVWFTGYTLGVVVASLFFYNLYWIAKINLVKIPVLYANMAVFVLFLGLYRFNGVYSWQAHNDFGKIKDYFYENFPDHAVQTIEDDTFYRVDRTNLSGNMSGIQYNLPFWYEYNGGTAYITNINPYTMEYYRQMGNAGYLNSNVVGSIGEKFSDEALACVKYYIEPDELHGHVQLPYGFDLADYSDGANVYRNAYTQNILKCYSGAIDHNSFLNLNAAQKQEIILKKLVLPEGIGENVNNDIDLRSKKIACHIVSKDEVEIRHTQIQPDAVAYNDCIVVHIDESNVRSGELYVELKNIEWDPAGTVYMYVNNGSSKTEAILQSNTSHNTEMNSFAFNLGCYNEISENERYVEIYLRFFGGDYNKFHVGEVNAYIRDLTNIVDDINNLNEMEIDNLAIKMDSIEADIDVGTDKYICLSVPYNKNWHCYIDDEETNVFNGNIMYVSTYVRKGNHHISFKYIPKDFYVGICISILALVCLVFAFMKEKDWGKG